jgi:hypothetical protein
VSADFKKFKSMAPQLNRKPRRENRKKTVTAYSFLNQHRRRKEEADYLILKKALEIRGEVFLVVYGDHFLEIYYINRPKVVVYGIFYKAQLLLDYKVFYTASQNTIAGLYHNQGFVKIDGINYIRMPGDINVALPGISKKDLKALKLYCRSKQMLADAKRAFK